MKILLAVMTVFVLFFQTTFSSDKKSAKSSELDGKTFVVSMVDEKKAEATSELQFKDGTMFSTSCAKYGFEKGDYKVESKDKTKTFTAVCESKESGKNSWSGEISGDDIKGELVWTDGKKTSKYTFTGKIKAKEETK